MYQRHKPFEFPTPVELMPGTVYQDRAQGERREITRIETSMEVGAVVHYVVYKRLQLHDYLVLWVTSGHDSASARHFAKWAQGLGDHHHNHRVRA